MDNEEESHIKWLVEKYSAMLAKYLNQTALIEDKIDEILTHCFLGKSDKKWEYIRIILSDITFSNKIRKLDKTLKEMAPEISELFSKEKLTDRLEFIRKKRNLFAHSVLNSSPKYISKKRKDEIAVLNPRDKQPHTPIKIREFVKWSNDATSVRKLLTEYLTKIEGTEVKD